MPDETPSEILGSLPRTRPHRRSEKRGEAHPDSPPATVALGGPKGSEPRRAVPKRRPRPDPLRQPKQPSGTPPAPHSRRPIPASGTELLSTVAQATAEVAEIGLSAGARALRGVIRRLPRP